jgi:histidinol-phosphatase (PHP family)
MQYFNYHTHSVYCDGSDTPEAIIKEAIHQNMSAIGFSGHAPLPIDNNYCIREDKLDEYKTEIRSHQKKYADRINIFLGLEVDYVPGIMSNFSNLQNRLALDYIIGSVHLVKETKSGDLWFIDGPETNYTKGLTNIFHDNIELAVQKYYEQVSEMIHLEKPTIIGHIDKVKMNNKGRFFSEDEKWYKDLLNQTLKIASKENSIIEVNTRGIYKKRSPSLYPGIQALEEIYRLEIPVTISSDAHKPHELTLYFPETIMILKDIGFKKIKYFTGEEWVDQPI